MALTTAVEMKLAQAGLSDAFYDDEGIWLAMAREAYRYTESTVVGRPKQDDVSPHLALALQARDEFVQLKDTKGLRAQRWFQDFADLVIARTWDTLTAEAKSEDNRG